MSFVPSARSSLAVSAPTAHVLLHSTPIKYERIFTEWKTLRSKHVSQWICVCHDTIGCLLSSFIVIVIEKPSHVNQTQLHCCNHGAKEQLYRLVHLMLSDAQWVHLETTISHIFLWNFFFSKWRPEIAEHKLKTLNSTEKLNLWIKLSQKMLNNLHKSQNCIWNTGCDLLKKKKKSEAKHSFVSTFTGS